MAERLYYHVALDDDRPAGRFARPAGTFRGITGDADVPARSFNSDEAAARFFLGELLDQPDRPVMRSITQPERGEQVPGLRHLDTQELPATGTRLVRFTQAHRDIPVFGARAVVELTAERELVSADARLHEIGGVDPVPSLAQADALARVGAFTGTTLPPEVAAGAELNFYEQPGAPQGWHLAWYLKNVPAAPPEPATGPGPGLGGHGLGPRPVPPRYHYLVDAHDGEVLFFYSADPTVLETPVKCSGLDEDGGTVQFWGRKENDRYQLSDPLRQIRTYDLDFADISRWPTLPTDPIDEGGSVFGDAHRAGVSAHYNATRVLDFYTSVLQRDGIDDAGMVLISSVNCTYQSGREFKNAFWADGKMWYGQTKEGDRLVSLARCLDVIAHELTHGVVESTSRLVYRDQSGALNESFADIFGIIIKNWYGAPDRTDTRTWNWELGPGLGDSGLPLRDMADPHRTGYPAHMNEFVHTSQDHGGVHINSNIHNRLAYEVLTCRVEGAGAVFTPEDAAVLFYLGMARLSPLADFSDARRAVLDVALTYFDGHPQKQEKLDALSNAYDKVGIV